MEASIHRFKEALRNYPDYPEYTLINGLRFFYDGLSYKDRERLDGACPKTLLDLDANDALDFLNEIDRLSTSYIVKTENVGAIKLDPICVQVFMETGRPEDLVANIYDPYIASQVIAKVL